MPIEQVSEIPKDQNGLIAYTNVHRSEVPLKKTKWNDDSIKYPKSESIIDDKTQIKETLKLPIGIEIILEVINNINDVQNEHYKYYLPFIRFKSM